MCVFTLKAAHGSVGQRGKISSLRPEAWRSRFCAAVEGCNLLVSVWVSIEAVRAVLGRQRVKPKRELAYARNGPSGVEHSFS